MTKDRVIEVIMDTLKFDNCELTETTDLFKDLNVDSLDAVELVMALEEEFSLKIPDEELPNMNTVGNIVAYIDSHQ